MSSEGWRSLVGKEWASCVLHNLPFFSFAVVADKKNIIVYQQSAADWNFYDFKEKLYQKK
jgi:hypothetical protein